ncbi:unnamed protein product [Gordionus sp. m RMFG-2023]|uniref:putative ferric-chelate reductase 1 n=1 Tax=Gordionus sp. m RMFG-2023 TaxID=3053472 RepID=UPI0030E030DA
MFTRHIIPCVTILLYPWFAHAQTGSTTETNSIIDIWYAKPSRAKCGTEYGCFSDPEVCEFTQLESMNNLTTPLCQIFLLHRQNPKDKNKIDFYLERKGIKENDSKNKYIALGLGPTKVMAGSSAIMCMIFGSGNNAQVLNRYNKGYENQALPIEDGKLGLSDTKVELVKDVDSLNTQKISCKFTKDKTLGNDKVFKLISPDNKKARLKRQDNTVPISTTTKTSNQSDTNLEKYHLILVEGNMNDNGEPKYHAQRKPHVSTQKFALAQLLINSAVVMGGHLSSIHILTKLHGIFMLIGWIFLVSVATLYARHLKLFCPQKTYCGGLKLWFVIHRSFNILAVILIIIATILIFVRIRGWSYNPLYLPNKVPLAHSITGILAIIFAVIQPIIAYFRPHPGVSVKRITFNWFHRLIGTLGLLLAVASIFLATKFTYFSNNDFIQSILKLMIAAVFLYGTAEIILWSIHFVRAYYIRNKHDKNKKSYDLTNLDGNNTNYVASNPTDVPVTPQNITAELKLNNKWELIKFAIVNLLGLLLLGLLIAMIVQLARA